MVDVKTIKDNLTNEQVISVLYSLGSDGYKTVSGEETLIFQTLCHNHNGDGSYKLYYYPESKILHCYTSCGDSFDIFELVMRNKKCSFTQAVNFICSAIGLNTKHSFKETTKKLDDWDLINRYIKEEKNQQIKIETYNENIMSVFKDIYYSGWINEGISIDTMKKFNIRYDIIRNAIIIPHYNTDNELIGIRRRALNQSELDSGFKYMPLKLENVEYSHPLMFNLYGLNHTLEGIKRIKKVIIFEAEKSVLLSHSFYGEDCWAVAVCGSNISNFQRDLLLSYEVSEVMIAFDKEYTEIGSDEYKKYEQKIFKIGQKFAKYVKTWAVWDTEGLLGYKDSPCDKGKEVLERLLKTKQEIECEE